MTTNLTVPGLVVKWIVIPAIVGVAGYFLVGPWIGKRKEPPPAASQAPPPIPQTAPATPASASTPTPEPGETKPVAHKHRKPRHRPDPQNSVSISSENYPQISPSDQGATGSESTIAH